MSYSCHSTPQGWSCQKRPLPICYLLKFGVITTAVPHPQIAQPKQAVIA
ncbi:MAG: hypothetical protein M5U34_42240 [Chloroflexi bacterium]|nr:hypothetical protein [Chloroflexota bacterium]